ncbi:hypothetical protein GPECTOR_34g813 [Gonium pectorale]|uniref:Uncharacterized protein n=1 Tax=Gonium pectorale TaxID=33097 RepID=A0A150GCT6_GONPE|nr:hypothetical protein GPECTOR_34g813 [Gonium pectorale]|eukprot:KXZ47654.1 hypothetical protein GPECTOR_34g813 [Gonium pectorale]
MRLFISTRMQLEVDKSIWDLTKGYHAETDKTGAVTAWWQAAAEDTKGAQARVFMGWGGVISRAGGRRRTRAAPPPSK